MPERAYCRYLAVVLYGRASPDTLHVHTCNTALDELRTHFTEEAFMNFNGIAMALLSTFGALSRRMLSMLHALSSRSPSLPGQIPPAFCRISSLRSVLIIPLPN